MVRIETQGTSTVSVGGASHILRSDEQTVSVPEQKSKGIELDDLVAQFQKEVPDFEREFREAGREIASLAETSEGGATITSLRIAAGLTQKAFAKAINWQQPNVSALEAGQRSNPHRETMRMMCKVLGCDMNQLDIAIENSKNIYEQQVTKQERVAARIKEDNNKSAA